MILLVIPTFNPSSFLLVLFNGFFYFKNVIYKNTIDYDCERDH